MKLGIILQSNKPEHVWNTFRMAITIAIALFTLLSLYILFRRGYYNLYIANKAFAGTGALLLGIVLLIGPLSRMFSFADRYVRHRKELGIVAFLFATAHGIVSLFFLPSKFPLSGYIGTAYWPFIFGLTALIVLGVLFFLSIDRSMQSIGKALWWRLQYWGVRISFILIMLHVLIMKWGGWVAWYREGGGKELAQPQLPGAGLLVGWFMGFVLFVRLTELTGIRLGKIAWYAGIILLGIGYALTFYRGGQF